MSQNNPPYVEFMAGQLIAAEVMNDMQSQIRADIGTQTQTAVDNIEIVDRSEDANKLDGQTLDEIKQSIIDQAVSELARRSGYMRIFRKLQLENEVVIEHGLQNCPLVDLYQLDYFEVVAAEDDYKYPTWVNFYLYHSSEKRIRFEPDDGTQPRRIEIEPADGQAYRIPFRELLAWYNVKYNDESSLGDIETEFWDALFAAPSERFDDDQYAKSPWFDRCCRDDRTVKSLKQRDDWNELWVKVMPRKTTNYTQPGTGNNEPDPNFPTPAPTNIGVSHFDLNRMGLRLLAAPIHAQDVITGLTAEGREDALQELKVMALLRA